MEKLVEFGPLKSFISLPIVWGVIGILTLSSILVATLITVNSDFVWNFDYQSINKIFTIYKLPLTILALIIPIVALLAANHRSEQTKAQILAANEQNIFANYYKHIEEFEKFIGSHILNNQIKITNIRNTHKALFPSANLGSYALDNNIDMLLNESGLNIAYLFNCFKDGHRKTQSDTIIDIENITRDIERRIGMNWSSGGSTFRHSGVNITVREGSLSVYISSVLTRIKAINTIASFDIGYITPLSVNQILGANLKKVPNINFIDNPDNAQSFELIKVNT